MARDAEKKRAKALAWYRDVYGKIWLGVLAFYVLFRVVWHWGSFSGWHWAGFAALFVVNNLCLNAVYSGAAAGNPFSSYQDLLFVNWFVMVTTALLSDSWWWTYLVVPAYAVFRAGKFVVGWATTPDPVAPRMTEREEKALEKKRRKEELHNRRMGNRR